MVCHTDSVEGYNGVVAAASYEARPYGVRSGMSVLEAKKLCPKGVYVPGDYHKYLHNTKEVLKICQEFTDKIEVFSIDEMWLDIAKTKRFFGDDPARLAYLLQERIRRDLGLSSSIGIGPNKLVAKMAGELHKPGGITLIRPGDLPDIFAPLPVGDLFGVGRQMKKRLNLIGVTTIGDLAEMPGDYLKDKFGVVGLYLKDAALGRNDSILATGRTGLPNLVKSFGHSAALGGGEADVDQLCRILLGLCEGVTRRMRRDKYAGRTVVIRLRLARLFGLTRSRTVTRALELTEHVYPLAKELLLAERGVLYKYPATLVGVSVTNLAQGWRQLSIEDLNNDRWVRAAATVDQIKDKYGSRVITRASLLNWKRRYHAAPVYGSSGFRADSH